MNHYIKENVRHRAFKSPGFFYLTTRLILYPTTEKNHPVESQDYNLNNKKGTSKALEKMAPIPLL